MKSISKLVSAITIAAPLFLLSGCGQKSTQNSKPSWDTYDPETYPLLLINKVDYGQIYVYVVGEDNLLLEHISESIDMWTSSLPILSVETIYTNNISEADLVVEVQPRYSSYTEKTFISYGSRPVITIFQNHDRRTLLHEIGHAMGMKDTYFNYHERGFDRSVCDFISGQPPSIMCLGANGKYMLYQDDLDGIRQLYDNRIRG